MCYADGGVVFTAGNVYPQFKNTEREVTIAEDPDDFPPPPIINRQVLPPFTMKDNQKVDVNFFKLRAVPKEGLDYYYLDRRGQCRCLSCPNKVTSRCGLVQTRSVQVILLEQGHVTLWSCTNEVQTRSVQVILLEQGHVTLWSCTNEVSAGDLVGTRSRHVVVLYKRGQYR